MPQKEYNFDPHAIPADLLAAIGEVAVASAHTEYVVELAIRGCGRGDITASKGMTARAATRSFESALNSLAASATVDADRDRLGELLQQISYGFERAAIYIHNSVCLDPQTGECLIATRGARGELSGELIPVTAAEIRAEADFIYQGGIALLAFLMQKKLLPTLRRSARSPAQKGQPSRKRRDRRVVGE
ncbi:hypothetical protein NML43_04260 [Rhodopseudomonas palustris]|uniref:hypothetical protein n=1 Tax=Rhodopseudomonas palustris TaxID=1076 RepID=UPI0020CD2CB7|nr:hypothetical protein [Rhodopseudomonas palustris]MCP9626300.1 hypothetical protein [Rhodopseudomonas palustris]